MSKDTKDNARTWGNTFQDTATGIGLLVALKSLFWDEPAKPISVDCAKYSETIFNNCASAKNLNAEQKQACADMRTIVAKHCM